MDMTITPVMKQNKKLFPYFQPIIGVASGKIIGYEALARQYDEHNQIISAGSIFSCKKTDISQLLEWDRDVRWQALVKFSQLTDDSYLTLNVSSTWIDYISDLNALPTLQMLKKLDINPNRIIIEITETKCDIDRLIKVVKTYRKNGLKVAIDDFGSGFSQLERVMSIQPDIIKIDMRLFKEAAKGGIASDIVHLLARLSQRTGCRIVCEGVETDEEFIFGLSCGAQLLQGYLFSQAEAEFQPALKYEKHIKSLRSKFSTRFLETQVAKNNKVNKIKALINQLKKVLQNDFNLNELASWNFEEIGILRFYLCDNNGLQTSPNFNFSNNSWFSDPTKIGYNWSWRSYFYHLLAMEKTHSDDLNHFVTSERYKDFASEVLCKTLSTRLDPDRILLVDIHAD